MRSLVWITVMFAVCLTALHAVADPYTPSPTQTPTKTEVTPAAAKAPTTPAPAATTEQAKAKSAPEAAKPAPVESDWRARAAKWFKSAEPKDRRKEMRAATRALKQSCFYCHTKGFKGYQDNLLISQQMMALSAEHDVTCNECHAGKREMTKLGESARHMWKLVHKKKVFCEHCHTPHTRFAELTEAGLLFKAEGQQGQE